MLRSNQRICTRSLAPELKYKLALRFASLLENDPTKQRLKQEVAQFSISLKTALRWVRNCDNMSPTFQKERASRSKLSQRQIKTPVI